MPVMLVGGWQKICLVVFSIAWEWWPGLIFRQIHYRWESVGAAKILAVSPYYIPRKVMCVHEKYGRLRYSATRKTAEKKKKK